MGKEYYDMKRRAVLYLRQQLASQPLSIAEMELKVTTEFGLGKKFVLNFIEMHETALREENGKFSWAV